MAECRHGLTVGTCGLCRPPKRPVQVDVEADGPIIPARYPGECANCGHHYGLDTPIAHVEDLGWVAGCCLTEV